MLIITRRALQLSAIAAVLFFLAVLIFLFYARNMCSFCASSELWRYSVVASIPTCLLAILPLVGERTTHSNFPLFGILTLVLAGADSMILGVWLGPLYIFERWAVTYNIVYSSWIAFPFVSGMIPLISVTIGLVSFNLTVAFREPLKSPKHWTFQGCWIRVIRNFLSFLGLVLLMQSYLAQSLSYLPVAAKDMAIFTILMTSLMLVPFFSLYSEIERRHWLVRAILGGGIAISLIELIPHLGELIGMLKPEHPFTLIPVLSLFLVCIGCAAGEIGVFVSHPLRMSRRSVMKYAIVVIVAIILTYVTWVSTHTAITVLI